MTEAEWRATTDIIRLLDNVYREERSLRKWRMFAIACCRSVEQHLSVWSRGALRVLEDVADGEAPDFVRAERSRGAPKPGPYADLAVWKAIRPGKEAREYARNYIPRHVLSAAGPRDGDAGREEVRGRLAAAARDIFGTPSRPAISLPAIPAEAVALALAAYQDRPHLDHLDPARLAVLSDALEEGGCTDEAILSHLRSPGPHVRGCWALDLVLGMG